MGTEDNPRRRKEILFERREEGKEFEGMYGYMDEGKLDYGGNERRKRGQR